MTTQIIVERVQARFLYAEAKKYLSEKYQNKLIMIHCGGQFTITPELIGALNSNHINYLIDNYGNPIKINQAEMLVDAIKLYDGVMADWHTEFNGLNK